MGKASTTILKLKNTTIGMQVLILNFLNSIEPSALVQSKDSKQVYHFYFCSWVESLRREKRFSFPKTPVAYL